jgi:hypothetical protein
MKTLSILQSAILAAAALTTAACSRAGNDSPFEYRTQLEPGSVVHIRDGVGNVIVSRATGPTIVVRGTRNWKRRADVNFVAQQRGNEYFICAMWRNSGKCDSNYRGRNTSGFLSMLSLFHHSSDATAGFVVELPPNVKLDVRTTSGTIEIDGASGGINARTVNGTVRATNVSGSLVLSSTNGDVRVSADSLAPNDSLRLTTTNGSVHAELPPGLEGLYDLSVVNGTVQSAIPLNATPASSRGINRHLTGQVGTAARTVKMRAVNGSVVVGTT